MFKTAIQHIKRAPFQALAAILIMSLIFFIIGSFVLLAAGSEKVLRYLETRPQVTAFLKDDIKPQQIELLKSKLETTGKVQKIKYVSKEEALAIYREENKDNPLLLEMVTAKILPASLEISAVNLSSLPELAKLLKEEPIVEEVLFQEDVISTLSSWVVSLRKAGIFLVLFLSLISIVTILIVIGMKISSRREEIVILELLGATKSYIRFPFIIEGMIYGILSALISWGLVYISLLYATPFLVNFLAGIPIFPISIIFMLEILGGLILLGILVGGTGSFYAVRRFFKKN